MREMRREVVIVGAGPSGMATSACLNLLSVPNIILEREDCCASLWKNRAYDRLNLHLAKQFCHLPHMPHPTTAPTFISRNDFIQYLDDYVSKFHLRPMYRRSVCSATYDNVAESWRLVAKNTVTGEDEEYNARFLVIASGENSEGIIPKISRIETFNGRLCHSSQYKSGIEYEGQKVLVVGCGNSGMEIALDLCNYGAKTSIVVRSPFHVLTREQVYLGMQLNKVLPIYLGDVLVSFLGKLKYGNLEKYGIGRPKDGPFVHKEKTGRSPVIDVGTVGKIKSGEIQVLPEVTGIKGSYVELKNGERHYFDAIVCATGYRSAIWDWLKDDVDLFSKDGMPKFQFPNHWKGKNGLYCAGLARKGLFGVAMDAQNIANDISKIYNGNRNKVRQT